MEVNDAVRPGRHDAAGPVANDQVKHHRHGLHAVSIDSGAPTNSTRIEQALVGGSPQRAGWFRFHFADESWEWSPQVQQMHGYEPGTVVPTTQVVLSHKHPADYVEVAETLEDVRRTHRAFSTRHRIIDTAGRIHDVVVVGDRLYDGDNVVGTHGFYIDVTRSDQQIVTDAVAQITERRAIIEQVKGMLMLAYDLEADQAFDLLKWRSQETNTKLRALAESIAVDFRALNHEDNPPTRATYDHVLLTAHEHVGPRHGQDRA
jgi:ANTAR domain/PAS fold